MANTKVKTILGLIMALVVAGLLIGYVFPVGMNAMKADNTASYTLSASDTVNPATNLNATLDDINSANGTVNMTLTNTDTGSTHSIDQLETGENTTVTTDLGDVTVANDAHNSGDSTVDVTFTYANEFGWADAEASIYGILGIFFVLTLLVALAGWAIKSFR